jgi:hypothetical protein
LPNSGIGERRRWIAGAQTDRAATGRALRDLFGKSALRAAIAKENTMPVLLNHHSDDHYLEIQLHGKLEKRDYELLVPEFETLLRQHGKLRLLVVLENFSGWTAGALWEDLKFEFRHFQDVERIAIVGEKNWHEAMAMFCKPFTTAAVKYFHLFELSDAREWLKKESLANRGQLTPRA